MDILLTLLLTALSVPVFVGAWQLVLHKILFRWDSKIRASIPPVPVKVRYLGGPLDGRVDLVPEDIKQPFFVLPYIPVEEDKRGEQYGEMFGKPLHKPNLAFYTQVEDDSYFYVKDISEEEFKQIMVDGTPPSF